MDNSQNLTLQDKIDRVNAVTDIVAIRELATELKLTFSGNSGADSLKKKIIDALKLMDSMSTSGTDSDDVGDGTEPDESENGLEGVTVPPSTLAPTEASAVVLPTATTTAGPADDAPSKMDDIPEIPKQPKPKGPPTNAELMLMNANKISDPVLCRQVVRAKALTLVRVRITNLDPADAQLTGSIQTVVGRHIGKVSKFIPYGDESEEGYHIQQCLLDRLKEMKFVLRKEKKGGQFGVKQYKTTLVSKFSIEILPPLTTEARGALASRQAASGAISND